MKLTEKQYQHILTNFRERNSHLATFALDQQKSLEAGALKWLHDIENSVVMTMDIAGPNRYRFEETE